LMCSIAILVRSAFGQTNRAAIRSTGIRFIEANSGRATSGVWLGRRWPDHPHAITRLELRLLRRFGFASPQPDSTHLLHSQSSARGCERSGRLKIRLWSALRRTLRNFRPELVVAALSRARELAVRFDFLHANSAVADVHWR
jgi:hypothetical protein